MGQHYYLLEQIPDLTLSKYAAFDEGNVAGVLRAHRNFWRQLNRKGLLNGESFHLFYEYNPDRPKGNKLCIGLRIDTVSPVDTFIQQTIGSSALSPYFHFRPVTAEEAESRFQLAVNRRYQHSAHLLKSERFLQPLEYGREPYYMASEWEMNESARLYTMVKLMAAIDKPCLYVASLYPKDLSGFVTERLDRTLLELRNVLKPQVNKTAGGASMSGKDDHAKSTLSYYEDLLEDLSENPHFLVNIRVLSDDMQHAYAVLDAAASEALRAGSHTQKAYTENLSLAEIDESRMVNCASEHAPATLNYLPQLFLLEEASCFAVLPALFSGEWIERCKETVPAQHASGISLGLDDTGHEVFFPLKNLSKHAFLAGVPGSGKTNSMMHLINAIHGQHGIHVLIFEPAKHEYRALTCVKGLEDIELFSPSASTRFPLHINPFEFPQGMTLAEHIRNLNAVFDGAFSLEPPMPFLLDASIQEVYEKRGWLAAMVNTGDLPYPTMSELYNRLAEKLEETDYGPEVKGNLKSALQVRVGSLITREMADIFDVPYSSVKPDEWMTRSAIIELESLGKDPANFTTLLLATLIRETLKTVNYVKPEDGRPRHVMFFEEAHNLIGPTAEKGASGTVDPKQAATAYIVKMLAEVRALGEGIIIADQLPTAMAPEVIKNTSLKIGLRITAQDDRQLLGGTMNANPDQLEKFSIFSPGHALVSYEPLLKPFEVQLPYFEAKEGDLDDKTILNALLNESKYIGNLKRSVEISSEQWETHRSKLKERLNKVRTEIHTTRKSLEALLEGKEDISKKNKLIDTMGKANKKLTEIYFEAQSLALKPLAYQVPITFLFGKNIPVSRYTKQGIHPLGTQLMKSTRETKELLDEVIALINEVRKANSKVQQTNENYITKRKLLMKTAKTWDNL
ncbi:MAG: ATP-binding protein [Clostridia bacterium]|nr:ATP-binding protein [Clostridia bacterium]